MDYSVLTSSVCMYVENRVKSTIDYRDLSRIIGYSYPHIRKVFRESMQIPLSKYILLRKLNYAAFDLIHTDKSLLDIAVEYNFEQYDAFTRAFKRETGVLPRDFRHMRIRAGRRLIASGVYAPAILDIPFPIHPQTKTEVRVKHHFTHPDLYVRRSGQMGVIMENKEKDSFILLGVPKVEYKWEECTPFPSCLRSCLNYMGQDVSYAYLMAASGAAFRLCWSKQFWDGGNVDITYIYDDGTEAFRRSFEAAGRSYRFLKREESSKQGFMDFIKSEIDNGRPVIALGIIGPPEACIVTGYQDGGETLLGWNFFQHRPEYNKGTSFHECGYFISHEWWENECTNLLISIGESENGLTSDKNILLNALHIEDRAPISWEGENEVACGQEAYDTWASWTADDRQFSQNITLPLLNERFMCQVDAQSMVGEGRWHASEYLKTVAARHPEVSTQCMEASGYLCKASEAASRKMYGVMGEHESQEMTVRHYAEPETRKEIVKLIKEAADYEAKAMVLIEQITERMLG